MGKFKLDNLKGAENFKVGSGLLNDASKASQNERKKIIYINIDDIIPNKKNQYSMTDIDQLAQQIDLSGELEQPLVVRQDDEGNYILLTGHRRLRAIKLLREQGKWKSDVVECIEKNLDNIKLPLNNDMKETLAILTTNQVRNKTDADIAMEIKEWKEIFAELRKQGVEVIPMGQDEEGNEVVQQIKGEKTRDLVSNAMGISPAQVGKFEKVENQGSEELKNALLNNKISVSTASAVSNMPKPEQKEFIEKMDETKGESETITKDDILLYKKVQEEQNKASKKPSNANENNSELSQDEKPDDNTKHIINSDVFKNDIKKIANSIKKQEKELDDKGYSEYLRLLERLEKIFQ